MGVAMVTISVFSILITPLLRHLVLGVGIGTAMWLTARSPARRILTQSATSGSKQTIQTCESERSKMTRMLDLQVAIANMTGPATVPAMCTQVTLSDVGARPRQLLTSAQDGDVAPARHAVHLGHQVVASSFTLSTSAAADRVCVCRLPGPRV